MFRRSRRPFFERLISSGRCFRCETEDDMTATRQQILQAATLMNNLLQIKDEGEELERAYGKYKVAMDQLDRDEVGLVLVAKSLMGGRAYTLVSDDPDSIRRTAALALEMGATVNYGEGFVVDIIHEL